MTLTASDVLGAAWDATLLALRSEILALRFTLALRHAGELARLEAKYSPDQPRVPAGSSDGGQWTDGGGGSDAIVGGDGNDQIAMSKLPGWLSRIGSNAPKVLKPSERPLHDLMKPGGKELGGQAKRAGDNIRTLEKRDYSKLKSELLDGAVEVPAPTTYTGRTFKRPDGSIVGIRHSEDYGETLDVIKSLDEKFLENGYKVHSK